MVDSLLLEVGAEELGEELERDLVLYHMVLCERRQTLWRNLHLDDEKRDGSGNLVASLLIPLVEVAENFRQKVVLERALEIAVSLGNALHSGNDILYRVPVAKGLILLLKEVERAALIIEVRASGLEKATKDKKLEELFGVLEQLERGARLHKLGYERIGSRGSWYESEMEEECVTEDLNQLGQTMY